MLLNFVMAYSLQRFPSIKTPLNRPWSDISCVQGCTYIIQPRAHKASTQCWPTVYAVGPTLIQHWINVPCLQGTHWQFCEPDTRISHNFPPLIGVVCTFAADCDLDFSPWGVIGVIGGSIDLPYSKKLSNFPLVLGQFHPKVVHCWTGVV